MKSSESVPTISNPAVAQPLPDLDEARRSRSPSHEGHDAALTIESMALGHGYSLEPGNENSKAKSTGENLAWKMAAQVP